MAKITNDTLFDLMEIIGIIGLDIELESNNEMGLGLNLLETIFKNSKQAQSEIESLLANLTGIDTSNPIGLLKAVKECKNDEEVLNFFTEALSMLTEE